MAKAKTVKTKSAGKKSPPRKNAAKKQAARKPAKKPLKPAAKPAARRPARAAQGARGVPEQMRDAALKVLDERQADDIVTVNLAGKSSMADYLIIASGRAQRQIAAIAHYLSEALASFAAVRVRVEGLPEANWVLVDAGDIVVHLFRPEVRRYYDFDSVWAHKKRA